MAGSDTAYSLVSASKGCNLAGIKAALALAGPEAAATLQRVPEEVSLGASHLGNIADTAAFTDGDRWPDALLGGLDANRNTLAAMVAEHLPAVQMRIPQATFLAWLDFRQALPCVDDVAAHLVEHAAVALNPGAGFGAGGAGRARLNFATTPTILANAVERIAGAIG